MDHDLLKKEQSLYDAWLAKQPPAVAKSAYLPPSRVMKRCPRRLRDGEAELACIQRHELLEQSVPAVAKVTCAGGLIVESAEPLKSAASGTEAIGGDKLSEPDTALRKLSRVHEAGEVVTEIQQAHDTTTQLKAEFKDDDNSAGATTGNPPADRIDVTPKSLTGTTESPFAHIPRNIEVFVLSFDGSAETTAKGGYESPRSSTGGKPGDPSAHGSTGRVSANPKSHPRRIHFGDGYHEGFTEKFAKSAIMKSTSAECQDLSTLSSFIPSISNKYSNCESQTAPAQTHRVEVQVETEVDNCFPNPAGAASAATQAEQRRGTAEFSAEKLKHVNSKAQPEDELNDLSPHRVADTQLEFPLKEDPIAEKTQRAGKLKSWLGGKEFEAQRDSTDTTTPVKCPPAESTRYPFKEGSDVWLTMKRVKPRVKMKLVRHWRRPLDVKKTVDEHYKKRETRLQLVQTTAQLGYWKKSQDYEGAGIVRGVMVTVGADENVVKDDGLPAIGWTRLVRGADR
ncbi:hypothetical protein ON010_g13399 [Phytophthora cinnamomi]|nr:hypothetical protein ON010_g13399 [Phytophthora cinnamomi]